MTKRFKIIQKCFKIALREKSPKTLLKYFTGMLKMSLESYCDILTLGFNNVFFYINMLSEISLKFLFNGCAALRYK